MANIVFMGTPDFAVPSLDRLVEAGFKPLAVVTAPDRERGRGQRVSGTPTKEAAIKHGIETILQPDSVKDPDFERQIHALNPNLIIVVAFRILPPGVFNAATLGAFNLHGSLLPKYRGAAPIHRAVMAGETKTGVTTFFLKERVDTGNIIMQRSLDIGPDETTGDVYDRMKYVGADVVVETTRAILHGCAETSVQDDAAATPAPKVFRKESRIDWHLDRRSNHNFIRGLSPVPGAWTLHEGKELKLYRSHLPEEDISFNEDSPGTVVRADDELWVQCGDGVLQILELQQQGKRTMKAGDFLRGYPFSLGDRLS